MITNKIKNNCEKLVAFSGWLEWHGEMLMNRLTWHGVSDSQDLYSFELRQRLLLKMNFLII